MGTREFHVSGYSDDASSKTQLIDQMQRFMQRNNVSYAQLAVSTEGRTQLSTELAFTWSEPHDRQSTLSDIFLLASVSKAFCSAAVYNAFKGEDVSKIHAFPLMKYQSVPTTDPRANSITIQHLLEHKAGYLDSHDKYDYTYNARTAAEYLGHDVHTAEDLVKYAWAQPLGYTPGQPPKDKLPPGKDFIYSNISYVILSQVVETKTGMSYSDYLHSVVLKPLQITEVITIPTQKANYPHGYFPIIMPESAEDHTPWHDGSGPPSYDYKAETVVPTVFGGDGMVKEACEGAASLGCRAGLLAVFARHYGKS